jgi:hypothetical protein
MKSIFGVLIVGMALLAAGCATPEEQKWHGDWYAMTVGDPKLEEAISRSEGLDGDLLWYRSHVGLDCDAAVEASGETLCRHELLEVMYYSAFVFDDRMLLAVSTHYTEDGMGPYGFNVIEGSVLALDDIASISAKKSYHSSELLLLDAQIEGPDNISLAFSYLDERPWVSLEGGMIELIQEQTGLKASGSWNKPWR